MTERRYSIGDIPETGGLVSPIAGMGDIMKSTGALFIVCSALSLLFATLTSKIMGSDGQESRHGLNQPAISASSYLK